MFRFRLVVPAVLAVCAFAVAANGEAPPPGVTVIEPGVMQFTDPQAEFTATKHVMSDVPDVFIGLDVNTFLGADRFYDNGITGQGAIHASVEAGHIWDGHENLTHVSQFVHDPGTYGNTTEDLYDRHATWVGAHLGGRNSTLDGFTGAWETGLATGADLRSGAMATAWNGTAYSLSFSITAETFTTAYDAFFGTADVINSSYGLTDPDGDNPFTIAADGFANDNPDTTFVVSAGNAGSNANTVGGPASGYNGLAVAALGDANNYDQVASFSSRGPQDYIDPTLEDPILGVRAPVDIAAPGTNLTAAFYGGATGGNNPDINGEDQGVGPSSYSAPLAGTSFAAPIVASGASLLHSAQANHPTLSTNPHADDARVIKAVLLNSADKVNGTNNQPWDNGQMDDGGVITTTQSLDYAVGAGRMNLDRAYDQYLTAGTRDLPGSGGGTVAATGWDFGTVTEGTSNLYTIDTPLAAGSEFAVTLDWFRERSYDASSLTAFDRAFANLDLLIRNLTTGELVAQSISAYNEVEHLFFNIPVTGTYQIEVAYLGDVFDVSGGTHTFEEYGLAWFGTAIPEPGTLVLLGAGTVLLAVRRRQRMHA